MLLQGIEKDAALPKNHVMVGHEGLLLGCAQLRCRLRSSGFSSIGSTNLNRFLLRGKIKILLFCDAVFLIGNLWRLCRLPIAAANEIDEISALKQGKLAVNLRHFLFAIFDEPLPIKQAELCKSGQIVGG